MSAPWEHCLSPHHRDTETNMQFSEARAKGDSSFLRGMALLLCLTEYWTSLGQNGLDDNSNRAVALSE
jgi:hypothetical protein